jgi:hypothetical protein
MVLAAYANDAQGFKEAQLLALSEIMEERRVTRQEAEKQLGQTWRSNHPLSIVFKTKPTERQYQLLLQTMDDDGRRSVAEAIRMYNHYGSQLGVKASEGKAEKAGARVSLEEIRRRAASF